MFFPAMIACVFVFVPHLAAFYRSLAAYKMALYPHLHLFFTMRVDMNVDMGWLAFKVLLLHSL